MAKGFGKGFLAGVLSTVAASAGAIFAIQKVIIEPEEKKEAVIEELNQKKRKKHSSKKTARKLRVVALHIKKENQLKAGFLLPKLSFGSFSHNHGDACCKRKKS